jgi:hypothetical protein
MKITGLTAVSAISDLQPAVAHIEASAAARDFIGDERRNGRELVF